MSFYSTAQIRCAAPVCRAPFQDVDTVHSAYCRYRFDPLHARFIERDREGYWNYTNLLSFGVARRRLQRGFSRSSRQSGDYGYY